MKKYTIIVAGGKGHRMQSEIPKQFLSIARKPILMHTIERFHDFSNEIKIILVLPESFIDTWKSLMLEYNFKIAHEVVSGGDFRFESVRNGLEVIPSGSLVAIHDGVRPLVSMDTLKRVFDTSEKLGNAIPAIPVNESLRKMEKTNSLPVNRNLYRLIQTPQCFHSDIIKKAYEQRFKEEFTDDAMVAESMGIKINLIEGNPENIKITQASDIKIAEALMTQM